MLAVLTWIVFISGILSLAFFQSQARNWVIISAILLLALTAFAKTPVLILFWLIWFASSLIALLPFIRRQLISNRVLAWFKRVQPPISETERQVLKAGGTWWEAEFFTGDPDWEKILHGVALTLTAEEQAFLDGPVEQLCSMLNDWEIRQEGNLPPTVWDFIKQQRLWGLTIDKKYGGLGFSALAHSAVISKIATRSMSAAITIMVPNSLGPATFLEFFGTEEQRQHYLPALANGSEISCFALTSPEAGSDATSITDTGVVCYGEFAGQRVLGIQLNFNKRYITLAPVATLIGLACQLYDPENLIGQQEHCGITCVLIPANLPGVGIGDRHNPMNLAFLNGPIRGYDVFIPIDNVVGGQAGCGKGWQMLMECLSLGRSISLPSLATAAHQLSFLSASAYAVVRRQFKHSLGDFEGIADLLAKIGGYTYLSDATREFTAHAVDKGIKPSVASAIAKYHLTELARLSVNHALDIHGGRGIQWGPRNYLASVYDAIPISITVEGANILTRNLIIFGQGLVRCHPYLQKEMQVAADAPNQEQLRHFDRLLMQHVGFTLSRFVRTLVYGLSGGRLIQSCRRGEVKYFMQQLTRMSCAFALLTDISLLVIGAKLKFKEALSARFGDVVSYLYMATAVMRHYEANNENAAETPFMQWALHFCLAKIQQAFEEILQNYPKKFLGKILWRILFPWGNSYKMPLDECSQKIAKLMQTHSGLRDELTRFCYRGQLPESLALMEMVFQQTPQAELFLKLVPSSHEKSDAQILQQLQEMLQSQQLSQEDYVILEKFLQARIEAIQVDEFSFNGNLNKKPIYADNGGQNVSS